ncbi:MAG TPA: FkbM family methyltransferase [Crocinitomix sp.]|nr:FkbM family methyltransferase [Crocinitomix sp.]
MKNTIKYILQKLLGYEKYLLLFSKYKIKTLKKDKKEKDFFLFLNQIKGKGDILDVGANIGIMTYHLAKKNSTKTIYAIEPMPDNLNVLNKIISHYHLKNVKVLPNALSDKEGELEMVLPLNGKVKMQGLAHVVHHTINEWNEGEKIKVACITLDLLFKNKNISAIKMDIENFEYFALKGGIEMLKNNHPIIYLELWENENRKQCFSLLESLGYSAFISDKNNLTPYNPLIHQKQNFIFKVT